MLRQWYKWIITISLICGCSTSLAQKQYDPLLDKSSIVFFKIINLHAQNLNIYSSSSEKGKVLGRIPRKESCLAYLNQIKPRGSKKWVKVTYKGIKGWVDLSYLSQTNWGCDNYYNVINVRRNDVLNMRYSPHFKSRKVGQIPYNGSCLIKLDEVHKSRREWFMIEHRGIKGWVNSRYLKKIDVDECDI